MLLGWEWAGERRSPPKAIANDRKMAGDTFRFFVVIGHSPDSSSAKSQRGLILSRPQREAGPINRARPPGHHRPRDEHRMASERWDESAWAWGLASLYWSESESYWDLRSTHRRQCH